METAIQEKVTFDKYDPADYIETKETVIAFLEGALEENDPDFLLRTLGHIARSQGMTQIAKELNLDFSSEGNPSFETVFKLFDLLGFRLKLEPKTALKIRA